MRNDATHCYVAKRDGEPGAYAACVDMPDLPKETARFVSDTVKEGGIVERVPIDDAGKLLGQWVKWSRANRPV